MNTQDTITQSAPRNGHDVNAFAGSETAPSAGQGAFTSGSDSLPISALLPSVASASGAPPASHDWLTRLRDKWGNRLASGSAFTIPTIDDIPLEKTPLAGGLQEITKALPVRASTLHHFYDRKLLPALRRFWQVLDEEMTRLSAANAFAAQRNATIGTGKKALEGERDATTVADREALTDLEDRALPEAHRVAADRVADAGGSYDPNDPSDACVLRHTRTPLEVLAAHLRLPGPHGDAHAHLPGWLSWALTGLIGVLVGLSLGLVTHFLEADTITRNLPLAGVCAILGFGLATVAKWAIRGAWYRVGQDYYLGCPRSKWGVMLAGALVRSVIVLLVDVVMERQGLLALMQLQAATQALTGHAAAASALDALVAWIAPLVITLAYLYCAGDAGYLEGRREEVRNRLHAEQEDGWTATDTARRQDPVVQAALNALAHVRELLRQRAVLQARIAALSAPFDAKIAELEGQRLPEREELNTPARHRIQDSLDNLHGAQYTFDRMWEEAIDACEGGGGVGKRLLRACGGGRTRWKRKEDILRQ